MCRPHIEWARLRESFSVHCTMWPASPFEKVLGPPWAPAQCKHGQRFHCGNSYESFLMSPVSALLQVFIRQWALNINIWNVVYQLALESSDSLSLTDFVVSTEAIERNKSGSKQSHRPELHFLRCSHIGLLSLNLATVMIGHTLWRPWYYDSQITTAQGQNVAHWLKQKKGTFLTWETSHNFACLFIILSTYHSTTGKDYVLVLLSHLPSHVKCQVPLI